MPKIQVGDLVECVYNDNGSDEYVGSSGKVTRVESPDCKYPYSVDFCCAQFSGNEIKKITQKNNMDILEKAALAFKGEPERSFIKSGVMDAQELPTNDGVKLVVAQLLRDKAFADKFKAEVVDPILAEDTK